MIDLVSAAPASRTVPDALFGMNLEITRYTYFKGIGAQLLNNRKFNAFSNESFPKGWLPVGDCRFSDEDIRKPVIALSESPAGVICAEQPLRCRKSIAYDWRLCVRLRGNAQIHIRFGSDSAEIKLQSGDDVRSLCGKLYPDSEEAAFSVTAVGEGTLTLSCVSLLPEDSVLNGLRPDVLEALRALKPAGLRFPGGCYAEYYDWREGLLEQDQRPAIAVDNMDFMLGKTFNQDAQDMNIDDFVAVCRMTGAQPQFTVRMMNNTPEDAAAVVEYANGSADTPWGAVRAKRGYPEPYAIRRWYIGNEIYAGVPEMKDPVYAAKRTVEFAKAMKAVDASIELVPSNWVLCDWNERFMNAIEALGGTDLLAAASYHQYLLDVIEDMGDLLVTDHPSEPDTPEQLRACVNSIEELILPRMNAVRGELKRAGSKTGRLPIVNDEWNYFWGRRGSPLSALYTASLLHSLILDGENVGIDEALFFHPVNEGLLRVTETETRYEDNAYAWLLMRRHAGRRLLKMNPADRDFCASTDGETVYVTVINRSMTEKRTLDIGDMSSCISMEGYYAPDPQGTLFVPQSLRPFRPDFVENRYLLPPCSFIGITLTEKYIKKEIRNEY